LIGTFTGGTITKWCWDPVGMTWVNTGQINAPGTTAGLDNDFYWLAGSTFGSAVTLFATNGGGGSNTGGGTLWNVTDTTGYSLSSGFSTTTLTQVAQQSVISKEYFRGVAIVPGSAVSPPVVTGFMVNGGAQQRSRLTTITVNFAAAVDVAQFQTLGAVSLTRANPSGGPTVNTSNGLIVAPATGTQSSITLTFANVVNAGIQNRSLTDGYWTLAVAPAGYSFTSTNLDAVPQLHRLFGDINNDKTVDGSDFGVFGTQFGTTPGLDTSGIGISGFDVNNDGTIDGTDFGEFGNRFGLTL
jgi:hypothetical protein